MLRKGTMDEVEGVSTPAPAEEPVETPNAGEVSQTSEGNEGGEVEVQLSPKAQQRMQKLANEAREAKQLRADYQKLQGQYKQAEGALSIDKWLRADQRRAAEFVKWMQQMEAPQPQENPYAQYRPEIQELARATEELREWKASQEHQAQNDYRARIQENETRLEAHFEQLLKDKGYADEKGIVDESVAYAFSRGTLATLAEMVDEPRLATEKQVDAAFDQFLKGIKSLEKRSLKQVVKTPGAPPSGSGNGKVASQKMDYSNPDNRIAALVAGMKG